MAIDRIDGELVPLYPRLPYGPKQIARTDVERNQRTRLYGAMIESVHQRGYRATTVAHVITLAGVSRRAFYEQFPNKEQCFLATHDILLARERKRMIDAWQRERGWANRLRAAFKTLLDDVAGDPKGSRLVLIESLGIGARARERMQFAGVAFERLAASVFQIAPGGGELPTVASRAIVGGIRHLAFLRTLEDRRAELATLTDEVLDWIEAYRSPASAALGALGSRAPSRTPVGTAAFLRRDDERAQVLGSLVRLTLDEGYAPLADAQIAQFAGISTEAFHRHFRDKEECFLALLDEFVLEALRSVRGPLDTALSWPAAVDRAMAAFVEYLLANQALLRIAFIDLFEVGPGVIGRLTRSIEAFTELVTEAAPEPRRAPGLAREAITGAIWAVIGSCVAGERLSRLPELIDQLTFILLAPYIGPGGAVEAMRAGRRQRRAV